MVNIMMVVALQVLIIMKIIVAVQYCAMALDLGLMQQAFFVQVSESVSVSVSE